MFGIRALEKLKTYPMDSKNLDHVSEKPGLYAIFCQGLQAPLYVGQASGGNGLRSRLKIHFAGNKKNDNLAGWLEDDSALAERVGRDFRDPSQRQDFFRQCCSFATIVLDTLSKEQLNEAEMWSIGVSRSRENRHGNPNPKREFTAVTPACACQPEAAETVESATDGAVASSIPVIGKAAQLLGAGGLLAAAVGAVILLARLTTEV